MWYWHGTAIDITHRKELEQKHAETLSRYKAYIDISNTGAWEYDVQQDRLWFSDEYLSMLGYDAKSYRETYGEKLQNWIEMMHPEDRVQSSEKFRNYFNQETDESVYENYFRLKHKDGSWIWIWGRGKKLFSDHGEYLWKVIGTHINITETKNHEERLKESDWKYKIAVQYSPEWEYWLLPDRTYEYVSPYCEKICGYTSEEFLTNPSIMESIIHPEDKFIWKRHEEHSSQDSALESYKPIEFRIIHKDGSERWIKHVCKSVFDENGRFLGRRGTNFDITKQLHINHELTKHKKAVENSPVTIVITDSEGNIEYANPKFTEVTGYSIDEVMGKNPRFLQSGMFSKEDYRQLWATIKSGKTWSGEFKNVRKNGEYYWEYAMIAPIFSENGIISNFVAVKEDISLLKHREKELSEVIGIVTQQNDQLQEFNYILSHNIRSHAANIAAIVQEFRDAKTQNAYLDLVDLLGTVSDGLLNTLENLNKNLNIKRDVNIERQKCNLRDYVADTIQINKALIDEYNIDIRLSIDAEFEVIFNKAYLQSVFQNLISNAIRYRCTDKRPFIHISAKKDGNYVTCLVSDNGLGINLKLHHNRLFQLGQVFHNHPESRGLGLYIVKNQLTAMGGDIHVESEVGSGTTFEVRLPSVSEL